MKTHFHMKGYAPRLALKKRHKATRKWSILCYSTSESSSVSMTQSESIYGNKPINEIFLSSFSFRLGIIEQKESGNARKLPATWKRHERV